MADDTKAAPNATDIVYAGEFTHIYDPSVGESKPWYINDHCFIRGANGMWHLYGITHAEPADPIDEDNFAHAIALSLTQQPWDKKPFALSVDFDTWKEEHLWAPHVVFDKGTYYMFYCGGDQDHTNYKIQLATSTDLWAWKRHPKNPMVVDGFDARDPMVLRVGDQWVMYYTCTSEPAEGSHIVAARTSKDLVTWGSRTTAFTWPGRGTFGGPTESPFVVRRGEWYYLFCGPQKDYRGTGVYRSKDPFHFDKKDLVGMIDSHAAEIIRDTDGKWYVSHCGWGQGGVYLAPLYWRDGLDEADSSLPVPGKPKAQKPVVPRD
jgi:arabinan endo-1,5-alpha-L-arabinosidase